jgi:hypothetical protein
MKRSTKIIIACGLLMIPLAFVFNPFYWLMQPGRKIQEPELSLQEQVYFKELEKKYNSEIKRFYHNYTKKGTDTLYEENYNKVPFDYALSIDLPANKSLEQDSIFTIAERIKNSILNKNKNLKRIMIYRNYKTYEYVFDGSNDTLIEKKD